MQAILVLVLMFALLGGAVVIGVLLFNRNKPKTEEAGRTRIFAAHMACADDGPRAYRSSALSRRTRCAASQTGGTLPTDDYKKIIGRSI